MERASASAPHGLQAEPVEVRITGSTGCKNRLFVRHMQRGVFWTPLSTARTSLKFTYTRLLAKSCSSPLGCLPPWALCDAAYSCTAASELPKEPLPCLARSGSASHHHRASNLWRPWPSISAHISDFGSGLGGRCGVQRRSPPPC